MKRVSFSGRTAVSKTANRGSIPRTRAIINYTWPGRFHLIVRRRFFYITAWLPYFGRCHACRGLNQ